MAQSLQDPATTAQALSGTGFPKHACDAARGFIADNFNLLADDEVTHDSFAVG